MSNYPKHDKVVDSALADVGQHEEPMGSNRGPRIVTYQRATWLAPGPWPWCVAFCQYMWKQAGLSMPYKGAGAYALFDWADKNGWAVPSSHAIPGDGVIFNEGTGHGAILRERVIGSTVKTVDGNVSDRVDLRERPLSMVRGFVHIPELPVKPQPWEPAAKPGPFEVVSSSSGHKRVIFNGKASTIGRKLPKFLQRNPSITVRRRRK